MHGPLGVVQQIPAMGVGSPPGRTSEHGTGQSQGVPALSRLTRQHVAVVAGKGAGTGCSDELAVVSASTVEGAEDGREQASANRIESVIGAAWAVMGRGSW